MAMIINASWLTEECTVSDFKSVWRRWIELVMIIPHRLLGRDAL